MGNTIWGGAAGQRPLDGKGPRRRPAEARAAECTERARDREADPRGPGASRGRAMGHGKMQDIICGEAII